MSDVGDAQDRAERLDPDVLSDEVDDDPEGALVYPPDRPLGVEEYGTVASEERVDEPLAERAWREQPDDLAALEGPDDAELAALELADDDGGDAADVEEEVASQRPLGRLVQPGADDDAVDLVDDEADAVAGWADESDLSAEEAAVHLTAAPPYRAADDFGLDEEDLPRR
jgi:hypothetical protein